ncbi:MAG TPA: serine hydrolase domain-containing protein [Thermoanaerobaculia bacterium]|nr:serine hydrolase domain-containing protein [Thermoanaerobaculia bacterium]
MPSPLTVLERLIDQLVDSRTASAAVALVADRRQVRWSRAAGWARGGPEAGRPAAMATAETWFDYGSLTKPFVATAALALDRTGELPLGTRLGEVLAGADGRLARLQLGDLLRHGAGMLAWTPLYARCRSLAEAEALLLSGALLGARAGAYSDLDYLLWGLAAERALGRPLAALVRERVLAPLGLEAAVAAAPGDLPQVAESRMGSGREVALAARQGLAAALLPPPPIGQPQDGNARFLSILAGQAGPSTPAALGAAPARAGALWGHGGLFGTAAGLWRLGAEWLEPRRVLHNEAVAAALAGGGPFALGWWRRRHRGAGGPALSAGSFGHTGFAGGSLWIDPRQSRVFVLLAHRVDPESNMNRWRRRFHAAATRAVI